MNNPSVNNSTIDDASENRQVGLRKGRRENPPLKPSVAQNSKRAALGTISNTVAVRIQPSRAAKQDSFQSVVGFGQDENTCPNVKLQTKSRFDSVSTQSFTIHHDPEPQPVQSKSESASEASVSDHESSLILQLPCTFTSVVRQPLSTLSLYSPRSCHMNDDDQDLLTESPMVLDTSIEDSTIQARGDLLDVSEYAEDIYNYLREAEQRNRPKSGYMRKQPDITSNMRSILVDWLVEVAEEYKLQTETLYLTVSYIDRFLSVMSVYRGKLQLVGTASMFLASKFEEIYPPEVGEFVYITDDTYTKKQVLRMEHLILKILSFDVATPTIYCFLQRYCKLDRLNSETEALALYLCELTLLEADPYLKYLPSMVAAAAVALANCTFHRQPWSEHLRNFTGYSTAYFSECLHDLYRTFCNAPNYPQQAVREKYKSPKYHSVSSLLPPSSIPG